MNDSPSQPDWLTKVLTPRSSRRHPRTILGVRLVLGAWIVVVVAVLFSFNDWWAVVFLPFLVLDLWIAQMGWALNAKRNQTPGDAQTTSQEDNLP